MLFKRSNHNSSRKSAAGTPSTGSGSASSDSKDSPAVTNGNPATLKFHPDGTKAKPLQGLKAMDSDQRKRLAAVLSRTKQ